MGGSKESMYYSFSVSTRRGKNARLGVKDARLGVKDARLGVKDARLGVKDARLGVETITTFVRIARSAAKRERASSPTRQPRPAGWEMKPDFPGPTGPASGY